MRRVAASVLVGCGLVGAFAGCGRVGVSAVHFVEPANTQLLLMDRREQVVFPAVVGLRQSDDPALLEEDMGGRPVRFVLPDGMQVKGFLWVFRVGLDQGEQMAEVRFGFAADMVAKLRDGFAVTVVGYSSKQQPVYKMILGIERTGGDKP